MDRPDPDALLAAIQKADAQAQRGKLKIFFGMAAGVGKTYAMLQAAHERKAEGVDVVIAYIETHKRAETDELVNGLELIPRQAYEYRGAPLTEMDLDAVVVRKPQLVLVDELAHTNAPGARHPKRYQDVQELLATGIDVYTTLNVQHLESRADAVRQITGVTVHETIPDSLLETADSIELIDLTPEELRKRLAEGKVYTAERAETAADNFFRVGNLTALREMALRLTAERVDHQLQDYMQLKQIAGPWKSGERLMVAISPHPLSERLVRWTRRMAYNLEAPWLAVYVEATRALSIAEQTQLARTLALARELGGEVISTTGVEVVEALLRVARQRNVTQIVMGKPARSWWREWLSGGSLVDKVVRRSGSIDIYIVTGDAADNPLTTAPLRLPLQSNATQYTIAIGAILLAVGVNWLLVPLVGYQAVAIILLFTVSVLASFIGRGPTLLAAALSAVLWDFLFIPPRFTFNISKIEDALFFGLYFIIAIVMGNLTARLRGQEQAIRQREARTEALYKLAREVAQAVDMEAVLRTAVVQIQTMFHAETVIILRDTANHLRPHTVSTFVPDEKELSVAMWVFTNNKLAGRFTDTLPLAQACYFPLCAHSMMVGVLGVRLETRLTPTQENLLETFASQVALAIERELLDEAAERAALVTQSEKLYKTLLNSVSHELRTPIAAIIGASSSLQTLPPQNAIAQRETLLQEIQISAERLNRLVENLLDMSRLESGLLKPHLDWHDVSDLVSVAVNRARPLLTHHDLVVDVAPNLPLARLDFVLMEQVLVNLLHNAALYTPPGTRVRVTAKTEDNELILSVADRGPGLPGETLEKVFEKFYRAPGTAAGGTGLGLSIVHGLVEAHGGTIIAENRINGGIRFIIRIPLTTPPAISELEEQRIL